MSSSSESMPDLTDGAAVVTAVHGFTHRLRAAGVPVSMVETFDCMSALRHIDITERTAFRAALVATLVKRAEHASVFDALFDTYFALRREGAAVETSVDRPGAPADGDEASALEPDADAPSTDLLKALLEALRAGDRDALRALAERAVRQFGRVAGENVSERYYLYRVLRQLELSELLTQAMRLDRPDDSTALKERLLRDEHLARMEEFRRMIAEEIRRQITEKRGTPGLTDAAAGLGVEDVEFVGASPTELRQMREAIRPLARTLAARIARRRRARRRGRLDARRTFRRSLSSGGVPLEPAFRHPHASKPELYLLCDISGSVAEFARFTMSLLYAAKSEFSRIRLFTFVDGIDEVTELMKERGYQLAPRNLLYGTKVVVADGHSDYGNVFRRFWHLYGHADLDPRSTVIITGDARNNYRDPGLEALRQISERARAVYWLNPEPRAEWDTTDSIASLYAGACRATFETRTLRQLADFVANIG
jgi:uncharacterized protein with von Willebrand factor type A (vWA) domain